MIKEGAKITEAIQICYNLDDKNKEREIIGLLEAMDEFKLKKGLILTYDQTEEITREDRKIMVIPMFRWLAER